MVSITNPELDTPEMLEQYHDLYERLFYLTERIDGIFATEPDPSEDDYEHPDRVTELDGVALEFVLSKMLHKALQVLAALRLVKVHAAEKAGMNIINQADAETRDVKAAKEVANLQAV